MSFYDATVPAYLQILGSLSGLLAALDRYSLEQQRPITLPLLREVLLSPPFHKTI